MRPIDAEAAEHILGHPAPSDEVPALVMALTDVCARVARDVGDRPIDVDRMDATIGAMEASLRAAPPVIASKTRERASSRAHRRGLVPALSIAMVAATMGLAIAGPMSRDPGSGSSEAIRRAVITIARVEQEVRPPSDAPGPTRQPAVDRVTPRAPARTASQPAAPTHGEEVSSIATAPAPGAVKGAEVCVVASEGRCHAGIHGHDAIHGQSSPNGQAHGHDGAHGQGSPQGQSHGHDGTQGQSSPQGQARGHDGTQGQGSPKGQAPGHD